MFRCCKRAKLSIAFNDHVLFVVWYSCNKLKDKIKEQCDPLLVNAWPLVNATMPCPHLLAAPAQCDASESEDAREHDMVRMRSIANCGPSAHI